MKFGSSLSARSSVLPCRMHRLATKLHKWNIQTPYKDRKMLLPDKNFNFIVAFQRKNEKVLRIFDRISNSIILLSQTGCCSDMTGSLFFGRLKSLKIQSGIFSGKKSSRSLVFPKMMNMTSFMMNAYKFLLKEITFLHSLLWSCFWLFQSLNPCRKKIIFPSSQ